MCVLEIIFYTREYLFLILSSLWIKYSNGYTKRNILCSMDILFCTRKSILIHPVSFIAQEAILTKKHGLQLDIFPVIFNMIV